MSSQTLLTIKLARRTEEFSAYGGHVLGIQQPDARVGNQ
jgi:hypothetical protein